MMNRLLAGAALVASAQLSAQVSAQAPAATGAATSATVPVAQPDYAAEARRVIDGVQATGMVSGVLVDGKAVYTGAFGKANAVTGAPVTTDMLFPIASISKAFTTTALAILVDRKQMTWDDPVRKFIPEFAMYDPWVSEHFTVRDLLTHRSGLPLGAGDLLFVPDGDATAADIIKALPHLKPSTGFRDGYAYDNLLYVVAGEVIQRISGKSFQDFVEAEILKPVGMTQCATDSSRVKPGQPLVAGHERAAGAKVGVPLDPEKIDFSPSIAAAGGLNCPLGDMMVWAKFWLDGAKKADGKRLISEEQKNEVWKGVTPTGSGVIRATGGSSNLQMYALGWQLRDLQGTPMVSHSGGAPGVVSNFILLPQKNIAIFASSNDYIATAVAWTMQIADHLIDGKQDVDYIARFIEVEQRANAEARAAVDKAIAPPARAARPSLPLAAYVGTYRDPWYGTVTISQRGRQLYLDMEHSKLLDTVLTPYDGDIFAAIWPDRTLKADAFVTFAVKDGKATGITMKAISDITDFSFDFHDLNLVKQ